MALHARAFPSRHCRGAGGRLAGTVLSGWLFQRFGLEGCLWASLLFVLAAGVLSIPLPRRLARGGTPVPG